MGTAIGLWPHSPHTGIIGYLPTGEQVVAHNSKQRGQCVVTWPQEFNDIWIPFEVLAHPLTHEHGERIWQNGLVDVRAGVRWYPSDNCQDFVSRAYTGRNGSPTRESIFTAVTLIGGLAWLGSALLRPQRRRRVARR
jgi:hypothetical protein